MDKEFAGKDILDLAVSIERNGYEFYTETAKRFDNLKTVKLFHYLAEQELMHERFFKNLKESETAAGMQGGEFWAASPFGDTAGTRERIKSVSTVEEAIAAAIAFEKDTVVLYTILKGQIDPKGKGLIEGIIDAELDHIKRLLRLKKEYNTELSRGEDY